MTGPYEIGGAAVTLASARTVLLRSSAEMPVVRPCRTSTDTVKAVPSGASLTATMGRD